MSEFINASICVTDIPKQKIKQATNGKKYLNITVASRRETDQYGNTHTVFVSQTKEEREQKEERAYIGSGKAVNLTPAAATPSQVEQMPQAEVDDLPF